MPQGMIISSGSIGSTQQDVDAVLAKHHGADAIERPDPSAEPARDSFESEEEFTAAQGEWKAKQEEPEAVEVEEQESGDERKVKTASQKRRDRMLAPYKRQIDDLKKQLDSRPAPAVEPKKEEVPRPARADFNTQDEYEDALIAWGHKQKSVEDETRRAAQDEQERIKGMLDHYEQDKERAYEVHEDFAEVVEKSSVKISKDVHLALLECDEPCEIVYYLAKNPDYAAKLFEMTPLSAVKEVGRLELKLATDSGKPGSSADSREKPKPKPQLPAPIRPLSTAATASTATSRDAAEKKDFQAFKRLRRAGR